MAPWQGSICDRSSGHPSALLNPPLFLRFQIKSWRKERSCGRGAWRAQRSVTVSVSNINVCADLKLLSPFSSGWFSGSSFRFGS